MQALQQQSSMLCSPPPPLPLAVPPRLFTHNVVAGSCRSSSNRTARNDRARIQPRAQESAAPMQSSTTLELSVDKNAVETQAHERLANSEKKARRLVVAVNDTKESWCAVKWTLTNIYREGDVLHLVHCVPKNSVRVPLPATFLGSMSESMDYEEALETHAYEFINSTMVDMASSMKAQSQVDVLHVTGPRNAGDAVAKYSEDIKAGLVIIAAQPMGAVDEFFTGGCMSGHALEHCKQPILILPPQALSFVL